MTRRDALASISTALAALSRPAPGSTDDRPLPSWNDGPTRSALLEFVARVTMVGGPDFVRPEQRIAAFDNDGTLWCEKPVYVQAVFANDRAKVMLAKDPKLAGNPAFRAIQAGDLKALAALGEQGIVEVVAATHAGMTSDEFETIVGDWLATARHPRFGRLYTDLVYQPMLELLSYLSAHDFTCFIVSGGGVELIRAYADRAYGIPPERIVGSTIAVRYEERDGVPVVMREPRIQFIDDKAGKPVGIQTHIGRRPILAFGNSDGDYEMLRWTTAGGGARIGLIVHHTDAEREYAYDRDSEVGRLVRALDEAKMRGWHLADMKRDWATVFPAAD